MPFATADEVAFGSAHHKYDCLMDQETIRLIVVALGAVIAGIMGQLIAGAFNSQNTQASLEAAREAARAQWAKDQELEHARWLRDKKIEAYSAFVRKIHAMALNMAEVYHRMNGDPSAALQQTKDLQVETLRMLAPRIVTLAVQDTIQAYMKLSEVAVATIRTRVQDEEAYRSAQDAFTEGVILLELRMSTDLGIEVLPDGVQP